MQRPDPAGRITAWATAVVGRAGDSTDAILSEMMASIRRDVRYRRRFQSGTQDPAVTLTLGTGTCRDFALLMIEALRSLGFAARFVSGYTYNPHRLNHVGGGATHAWVQVYLPGCGWIDLDPTNGIFGNRDVIRVGVARDHAQALPLSGTYCGRRGAYLGMSVSVSVTQGVD
jgi:transglutaminase-like putative cysteine protease